MYVEENAIEDKFVFVYKIDARLALDYITGESNFEYITLLDYVELSGVHGLSVKEIEPFFNVDDFYAIPYKKDISINDLLKEISRDKNSNSNNDNIVKKDDDISYKEHELSKVIVFSSFNSARAARSEFIEQHAEEGLVNYGPTKLLYKNWVIEFTSMKDFDGESYNEAIIDTSAIMNLSNTQLVKIINGLRVALTTKRRGY